MFDHGHYGLKVRAEHLLGGYPLRKQRKSVKNLAVQEQDNVVQINKFLPKKKTRVLIYPKNLNQENYLLKLQEEQKNIVFAIGPAGTGKTMLACQWAVKLFQDCLLYTSPSPRDRQKSRMPSSA